MDELEELKVLINAETAQFKRELKKVQQEVKGATKVVDKETAKMSNSFKKMGGFIKGALIGLGLLKLGQEAIETSSNISEVQNVVETAFGSMTPLVEKFAKTAIDRFGMSELTFKRTSSTLMAMSKGIGFVGREAADMSINVAGLSGDMASFFNVRQDIAETALKSIWTGETEALKRFGVVMTQTNLQQFAMRNGMNSNIQAMSQQEQLMLRYKFVTESLSLAQGDFVKTQDSWANQTRILSERFKELLAIIGSGFIAVLSPVIRVLNTVLNGVIAIGKALGSVFGKMFGLQTIAKKLPKPINEVGGAGVQGMNNLGKSADKAGKSIKGLLAPFDDLNILAENASSGASDALNGLGSNANIKTPSFDISDVQFEGEINSSPLEKAIQAVFDKIKPFIDTITSIDLTPLSRSLQGVYDASKPIIDKLGSAFSWFLNDVLGPFTKWFVEKVTPKALDIIGGALKVLGPILDSVGKNGKWLYDNFLKPIAEFTAQVFVDTMDKIGQALNDIGAWMNENGPTIDLITTSVVAFFVAWKVTELLAFIQTSGGVVSALRLIGGAIAGVTVAKIADKFETIALTALYAKDFVLSLVKGTLELGKQIAQFVIAKGAKLADLIITGSLTAATWAHGAATTASAAATWALNGAIAVLTSPITLVVGAIAGLIAIGVLLWQNWDKVKEYAGKAWDGVKNIIIGVWDAIKFAIKAAWDFIVSLFSNGGKIFSGIVKGIGGIFKNIINTLLKGINWVIKQPFNVINGVLNFIKDINLMGFKPFNGLWGYDPIPAPQIPYLDVGTNYVARDGLAYIHQGEAVVPKKFNSQEFFGMGNTEQIELLKEQNALLRALLEKDNGVYLNGKDIHDENAKLEKRLNKRMNYE